MDDDSFRELFNPLMDELINWYRPNAILLQCGADSLTGDRLGCFNLTLKGHGGCVEFIKKKGLPLLVTGGGGYTVRNVARCWAYETAILLNQDISDELPYNEYISYYGPDYRLHLHASNMENMNTPQELRDKHQKIRDRIREIPCAPNVEIGGGLFSNSLAPQIPEVIETYVGNQKLHL